MVEFLKKAMDWVLEKELDLAKGCYANIESIDKQIESIKEKKEELTKKYQEDMKEIEHILERLNQIKEASLKCKTDK